MSKIALYLTELCLRHNLISNNLKDWCVYSIEKRLSTFITGNFLLLIGFTFFGPIPSLLFCFSLFFLRKLTNGYHARSYWRCLLLSIFVEIACLQIASIASIYFSFVLMFIANIIIFLLAPSHNSRRYLTPSELKHIQLKTRKHMVALNLFFLFLFLLRSSLCGYIAMGVASDALSLLTSSKLNA